MIHLPQSLKCYNYRLTQPHPALQMALQYTDFISFNVYKKGRTIWQFPFLCILVKTYVILPGVGSPWLCFDVFLRGAEHISQAHVRDSTAPPAEHIHRRSSVIAQRLLLNTFHRRRSTTAQRLLLYSFCTEHLWLLRILLCVHICIVGLFSLILYK